METDFYLIRHGEAELNLVDVVGGRSNDSPLTKKGIEQARNLREKIYSRIKPFEAEIVVSPAVRCIETFFHSIPSNRYRIEPLIQELDQGEWVSKARREVYTLEVLKEISKDPWNFKAPRGESQHEVALRMKEVILSPSKEGFLKRVLFTHGGSIKYLCAELFDWDKRNAWQVLVDNTSITHIRYSGRGFELIEFNSLK